MNRWKNWSSSVTCTPLEISKPRNIDELARLLGDYGREGRHVRVVGAGHSFMPLVQTNDVLISLDNMQGIASVDANGKQVTVQGGTTLKHLGEALHAYGLAQENLGDIDVQSIAGAISTGTHGSGIQFGCLSTQVEGLTLVTASGEIVECSPDDNPDIFKAAQVSLGTLGVIASVKLRVEPTKCLQYYAYRERLSDCLNNLDRYKKENRHFEFFWLPYTDWVQVKFLNETSTPPNAGSLWSHFNKIVLENGVYWVLSECNRLLPRLSSTISTISAQGVATVKEANYSHKVLATPRMVRFQEMEYNIPAEHFRVVLAKIMDSIKQNRFRVHFPVECRFVHSDDIWLSPAYQRESAYIAIHMYKGMPYTSYFSHVEKIFQAYEGRAHWGKMNTLDNKQLASLYPHWQDFRRIRATLDPHGMFLNGYLYQLFA